MLTPSNHDSSEPIDLRSAKKTMYQELIVSAGEAVFAEAGYDAAHMQDIAAKAGVSLKTLYNYFPGKSELYIEVKNSRGQALLADVESVITDLAGQFQDEPLSVILRGMETHLHFFMSHPNYLKINLLEGYSWFEQQSRTDPGQEDLWQRGRIVIESLFSFGIDAGLFVRQSPAKLLAQLISLQQTTLATWVNDGMTESIEEVTETTKAEFIRFFCVPKIAGAVLEQGGSMLRNPVPSWKKLIRKVEKND